MIDAAVAGSLGHNLFDLDLSYKVQVEPGGIAQVVGMARDFAAGDQLVVCLGDNIFEQSQAEAIRSWSSGALVFVKDVPDPENFGVVVYRDDGKVTDVVEGFWGDAGESIDAYYEVNDYVRENGANR